MSKPTLPLHSLTSQSQHQALVTANLSTCVGNDVVPVRGLLCGMPEHRGGDPYVLRCFVGDRRGRAVPEQVRVDVAPEAGNGPLLQQLLSTPPQFWFSRTCRAVVTVSCGIQDACAEELEAGAAVHGPLDGLDAVHLPFDGACVSISLETGLIRNLGAGSAQAYRISC